MSKLATDEKTLELTKRNRKILVIAESIDVDNSSGSKGRVALIHNLKKCGYELLVYHYSGKEIQLPRIDCRLIPENRRSFFFMLSRMERFLRLKVNMDIHQQLEKIFGFSFTLFNDRNSIVQILQEEQEFEPEMVMTLSQGSSFRPHHALLKIPKWHHKWIAYIHDPYPMHSYPRPYDWVEPGHQKKREFFLQIARKAAIIAYPSKLLAEWMESYYHPLRGKSVIVPHQIHKEEFDLNKLPSFFKKEKFNIIHAGTLLSARNPLPLLLAYQQFLKEIPAAQKQSQLIFIGGKSCYSKEFEKFRKEVSQFYYTEDYLDFKIVLKIQSLASVNIILEAKGPVSPFLPGKFAHCIQADKPILLLGPYYSESKRLLEDNYPFWSEIDDKDKIKSLLKQLFFLWKKKTDAPTLERPDLENYLSEKHLKSQMALIEKKITKKEFLNH